LNAMAPTTGGHGYVPVYHQNAFGALESTDSDDDDVSMAHMVATQVAALTYQSQLTQSTAATTTQRQEMQLAQLAATQEAQHATLHQIIEGLNAVPFNVSNAGRGTGGRARGQRGHPGPGGRSTRRRYAPPVGSLVYNGVYNPLGMTHTLTGPPPFSVPGRFSGDAAPGGIPAYRPPTPGHGGVHAGGNYPGRVGFQGGRAPLPPQAQPPYSNVVKRYANWNACYSCGFDVADGHTSMSCPPHLRKATHQIGFNRQNAQQYIDLGHPCSTRNRHKTQFRTNM
jgi:hypothetical protein